MKLGGRLEGADAETLRRGTQTIVSQVAAMKHMVDDFAIYARQPRPGQMQSVDLAGLPSGPYRLVGEGVATTLVVAR